MEKITDLHLLKFTLLEQARNNFSFDILDYYDLTDIPVWNILIVLERNVGLSAEERKLMRRIVKANQYLFHSLPKEYRYDSLNSFIEERYNERLNILEIEVTREMKEHAINMLIENNYPIDLSTYKAAIYRIVKNIKEENLKL